MLNKLNTKFLLILLAVLVAIVALVQFNKSSSPKSTIPETLVQVDSAEVNRLVITPKNNTAYELLRESGIWKLKLANGKMVSIETKMLNNSFSSLFEIKPVRIVTRNENKFMAYEVTDSTATKVEFFNGDENLGGLYIGKFDFNQQTSSMSNFVRAINANEVLMVSAPLSFDWNKKANDWRSKKVTSTSISAISKIEATGQFNFSMVKQEGSNWLIDGITMDTTQIESYVTGIANLSAREFDDSVNLLDLGEASTTIEIFTDQSNDITLSLYNTPNGLRVVSSENQNSILVVDEMLGQKLLPQMLNSTEAIE